MYKCKGRAVKVWLLPQTLSFLNSSEPTVELWLDLSCSFPVSYLKINGKIISHQGHNIKTLSILGNQGLGKRETLHQLQVNLSEEKYTQSSLVAYEIAVL
jgi:hypothetical protein